MAIEVEEIPLNISEIIPRYTYGKKYYIEPMYVGLLAELRRHTLSIAMITVIINERNYTFDEIDGNFKYIPKKKTILLISDKAQKSDIDWILSECRSMFYLIYPERFVIDIRNNMAWYTHYDKLLLTEKRFGGNGKIMYGNITEFNTSKKYYTENFIVSSTVYFDKGDSIDRVIFFPGSPKCTQFCRDNTKSVLRDLTLDFNNYYKEKKIIEYLID